MVFPLPICHVLLSKIESSSKATDFEKILGSPAVKHRVVPLQN